MAIAGDKRPPDQPKDCDCQNLFLKLKRLPAGDQARKCCKHSTCTVAQLLKLCQMDPDCIMNLFKIAKGDEKCLPDVEMDQDGANKDEGAKYHFLMVDNSTQEGQKNNETEVNKRISEVKSIFRNSVGASTATATDRDRFDHILWTSVDNTPDQRSIKQTESPPNEKKNPPQKPKTEDKDREQLTNVVDYSQTRGTHDPDRSLKTVRNHMDKDDAWMQAKKPVPETDSLTMEIFAGRNSPAISVTQTPSILRCMGSTKGSKGSKGEEAEGASNRGPLQRKKSIIKTHSLIVSEGDRERGKSIIWSDNTVESNNSGTKGSRRLRSDDDSFCHLSVVIKEHKRRQSSTSAVSDETPEDAKERVQIIQAKERVQIEQTDKDTKKGRDLWQRFRRCMGFRKKRDSKYITV